MYNFKEVPPCEKTKRDKRILILGIMFSLMCISIWFTGCTSDQVKTLQKYQLERVCHDGFFVTITGFKDGFKKYPMRYERIKVEGSDVPCDGNAFKRG